MMLVDNNFLQDENAGLPSVGVIAAILVHAFVFFWFASAPPQTIMAAETFSPPTNVNIRFVTAAKEQVIQKKTTPKKIEKTAYKKPVARELNNIEPAAAPPKEQRAPTPAPSEILKPVLEVPPIISAVSVKGRRVQPEYPDRALKLRQEGVVWLHVLIGEDGQRREIKFHKPSQYALLNQAAMKAVKKWTFDPNIVNGRAVPSWVEIPIEFKIQ